MTPTVRSRLLAAHFDAMPVPGAMTSADELHAMADQLCPMWPRAAERIHAIACEYARMAEVLDQEVGQAATEWRAVGAFW
jgi:hypothetical protein